MNQSVSKHEIEHPFIKRLSKSGLKSDIPYEENIAAYYGLKNIPISVYEFILCCQIYQFQKEKSLDCHF